MPSHLPDSLDALARAWGLEVAWRDYRGRHEASVDAVVAVLRALGCPIESAADAASALEAPVPGPGCVVAWDGQATIPWAGEQALLQLEDGSERRVSAADGQLHLREVPYGAHELRGARGARPVLSAPLCAPGGTERTWGVFAPLYALRTETSWGVGDLTDLGDLGEWVGELGGSVVATLPLLAADVGEPSPYSPVSRLFFAERYLDLHAIPELQRVPEVADKLDSPQLRSRIDALRAKESVDPRGVEELKREVLRLLAPVLLGERHEEVRRWADADPHREGYAVFRGEREYHVAVQFWLDEQLRGLRERLDAAGVELYLDLPLGVHPAGYDAWAWRGIFAQGVSVGAPPDALFTGGQDWGFRPLHPHRSRAGAHEYLRACVRAQLRYASRLRIDHVLGVVRQYWVPHGHPATDGVYVHYPADEWLAALVLEAHRAGARLVGEDLGVVSPTIREALPRHGIPGMYLAQMSAPGARPTPGCVASWDTHDTATLAGWRHGDDLEDQVELGLLDGRLLPRRRADRERHVSEWDAVTQGRPWEWLGHTDAGLVLVTLEDLWGERRPQNVPGTWRERPNWIRPLAKTLEEAKAHAPTLERLDRARGRAPR